MLEELKSIGEEAQPEVITGSGIEQRSEVVPLGSPERVPERVSEVANERYQEILSKASTSQNTVAPAIPSQVEVDAKAVYDETDAEARVTKLVSLAETKGIEHAVRVAQKLNDFYVLDRVHDELSGKFYDALKAKGMIAE